MYLGRFNPARPFVAVPGPSARARIARDAVKPAAINKLQWLHAAPIAPPQALTHLLKGQSVEPSLLRVAMNEWTVLTNFGAGWEADFAVERLRSAGVPAMARGNDIVGIVGIGFQGTTARGVDVLVPEAQLARARDVLGLSDEAEPET